MALAKSASLVYVVLKQLPAMQKTSVGQLRAVTAEPGATGQL